MTDDNSIFIAAELLPALGYAWKGPLTTISPLHYPDSPEMEKLMPFLKQENLVGPDGSLMAKVRPVVEHLARAQTFTRVYLTTRFGVSEYLMYFMPDGYWISLSQTGKYVQIVSPGKIDIIVEAVRQQIGDSVFTSASLHASLSPMEALALAALWDLQRKAQLLAIADERDAEPAGWSLGEITSQASTNNQKYQWMTNVVRKWTDYEGIPTADEMKQVADSLVAKNYCTNSGGSYVLSGDALDISDGMLLFDKVVTLTSGIEGPDGQVAIVGFSCIQAGVHDLLMIDFQDGKLELDSVSATEVIEYIDAFMRKPQELLKGIVPQPIVKKEPGASCSKCGSPLAPGKKFCGNCGTPSGSHVTEEKVSPGLATCPKCGSPLTPGKKFCGSCGAPVGISSPKTPVCPQCGSPVTPGKKFCGSCGGKL